METRNLYYVLCVAENKSISKAAEKLFISQPTLSQHLQKLEKKLGIALFDRTMTPLKLTYAGEHFVEIASKILELEKQLIQEMEYINDSCKGRLTIGISAIHGTSLLPIILPKYKELFPGIEITLVEENALKLHDLTEQGKIDVTITNLPIENEQLTFEALTLDEIIIAIPETFLPTNFNQEKYQAFDKLEHHKIELLQLKDCPFLLLKQGHRVRQISDILFQDAGIKPKIIMESINIETLYRLTITNMGITFLPKSLILQWNKAFDNSQQYSLYLFSLSNSIANYGMVAIYNKYRSLPIAARKFIALIKEIR
ncbi:MAG: LysR family transcriptional regulator [Desulfosporosinus sp.]|nr:LysR family transcriptional regulator [Desulfosporosinus sp.]